MVMPDFLSLPPELPCGEWGLILQRISTMTRHIAGWYGVWGILTDPCNPYRGWGVQWNENSGRCGICGDPWDDFPREHEAPLGKTNMSLCRFYIFFQGNLPQEQLSGTMSQGPGYLSLLISPQIMVDTSYSSFVRTMTLHKTPTNGALISIF